MKIGISIPPHLHDPEDLFEWVRRVDTGPFSTLSVLDRVVYVNYEPLITLAVAAALSTRVRLMTEVLLAPLRNATILAKESATLDVLSRGRLTLGLGVGEREDDFLSTQADFTRRGKYLEEQISQMRSIWAGNALAANVGPVGPAPVQANGPEILLGGFRPRAIQRVGRYADGFITAVSPIEEIDTTFRCVEQSWQEAGRAGKPRLVAQMDIALETYHIGQGRNNIRDYCATMPPFDVSKPAALLTTERQLRETMHALQQIGTDEMICFVWSTELNQIDRVADVIG
jgi:alkanesulfonate monooxygenase SsuD/methylene tetrahydromethanopterin reductase-like flavin-dependent oxidoreductase (luciferase family)